MPDDSGDAAAIEQPTTPEAAQAAIATRRADPDFTKAFLDKYAEGHTEAVAEMASLHETAFPVEPSPADAAKATDPDIVTDPEDVAKSEAEVQLKANWGWYHDENLGLARDTAMQLGGQTWIEGLEDAGLGNDPETLEYLRELGEADKHCAAIGTVRELWPKALDRHSARLEITKLKSDPQFMKRWNNRNEPGHAESIVAMRFLHIRAYPGK